MEADGSVPLLEDETRQRVDVTSFNHHDDTPRALWVMAKQMENTEHVVRDIADAHGHELASQLRLNGYVHRLGVISGTGLCDSPKSFCGYL